MCVMTHLFVYALCISEARGALRRKMCLILELEHLSIVCVLTSLIRAPQLENGDTSPKVASRFGGTRARSPPRPSHSPLNTHTHTRTHLSPSLAAPQQSTPPPTGRHVPRDKTAPTHARALTIARPRRCR